MEEIKIEGMWHTSREEVIYGINRCGTETEQRGAEWGGRRTDETTAAKTSTGEETANGNGKTTTTS